MLRSLIRDVEDGRGAYPAQTPLKASGWEGIRAENLGLTELIGILTEVLYLHIGVDSASLNIYLLTIISSLCLIFYTY